jgi:cell division protein FtsB
LQNRIDALQKENDELKAQVSQLQKQMLSLMSKINFETLKQTGNGNTVNKEMEEE